MKKVILLTGTLLLLLTTAAVAERNHYEFTNEVENAIYRGTRSGKLTLREANRLQDYIDKYNYQVWKYELNGRLSKREKQKLKYLQKDIQTTLNYALNNREVTQRRRFQNNNGKGRGGNRNVERNPVYRDQGNNNNRDVCPPPRNNRPRGRNNF